MAIKLDGGFKILSAHKVIVTVLTRGDIDRIEEWISDNCDGEYYINITCVHHRMRSQIMSDVAFYLMEDIDAMAFKLRWE